METFENAAQSDSPSWPKNPWISIWSQPRDTIRAIVQVDPKRHVILLAALAGVGRILDRASANNWGDDTSLPLIILIALIGGSIGGIISLYIVGEIFGLLGSLFGGHASALKVRSAVAWSSVPLIWAMLLWIPKLALYGTDMFTSVTPQIDNQPWGILIFSFVESVIVFWATVIYLNCLGEVHGFSGWKSLGVFFLLPGLIVIMLFFGCSLLLLG